MGLADRLAQQQAGGSNLKAKIESLMREFAGYMTSYGVRPLRFMDRTGRHRERNADVSYYEDEYRPVAGTGWTAHVDLSERYHFVADTNGRTRFDLAPMYITHEGNTWWSWGARPFTLGMSSSIPGVEVVLVPYYRWNTNSPVTTKQALEGLGREAEEMGVDAVIKTIEDYMLHLLKQYRR